MMSARLFADKYPGQTVKLSVQGAKDYGLGKDQRILGTVVGFKTGQKGIIGSSKVAVWRDTYPLIYDLDPKTNKNYTAVVPNAPAYTQGIYFISVHHIELDKPVKPLKPVITYPDHCDECGLPCRKGKSFTVCSNDRCKSNRVVLKAIGPFPKVKTVDHDGYILCPTCQTNILTVAGSTQYEIICKNNHKFKHNWRINQKIWHQGASTYIWKHNGNQEALVQIHGKPTPVKYIPEK